MRAINSARSRSRRSVSNFGTRMDAEKEDEREFCPEKPAAPSRSARNDQLVGCDAGSSERADGHSRGEARGHHAGDVESGPSAAMKAR